MVGSEADLGVERAAQDLIALIWRRQLEAKKADLEMRKRGLADEDLRQATRDYGQLLMDIEKVKGGWEKAAPIIDLYLHQLAE